MQREIWPQLQKTGSFVKKHLFKDTKYGASEIEMGSENAVDALTQYTKLLTMCLINKD